MQAQRSECRHARVRKRRVPDDPEGGGRQSGGGGGQLSAALPPKVEGGNCGGVAGTDGGATAYQIASTCLLAGSARGIVQCLLLEVVW